MGEYGEGPKKSSKDDSTSNSLTSTATEEDMEPTEGNEHLKFHTYVLTYKNYIHDWIAKITSLCLATVVVAIT